VTSLSSPNADRPRPIAGTRGDARSEPADLRHGARRHFRNHFQRMRGQRRKQWRREQYGPDQPGLRPERRVLPVTARPFAFNPVSIVVRARENIAIQLHALDTYHTFTVEGTGTIVSANAGSTRTGGLRLDRPGRYTCFCSVPGHRAAGMVGTIIVTHKTRRRGRAPAIGGHGEEVLH
jgi:plastocyanin